MFMGHYGPAVWDTQRGKGVVLVPVWMAFLAVQFMDIGFALSALFVFMGVLQFGVITAPGIQVQAGTFDPSSLPEGVALGVSALFTYAILTVAIVWIEKRRTPNFSLQT